MNVVLVENHLYNAIMANDIWSLIKMFTKCFVNVNNLSF